MASRKLIVEVVGDSRSLERTFARSSKSARNFSTQTTSSLGKVDQAFSRTQRIAAGGFIGGAAISATIAGIRQVSLVAAESEQVLGQTRVALESTGKSWDVYGKQIEEAVKAQSRLGFDDEALLQTFSQFQRTTGDVGKALELNNLAMDVARARFIDLEQAANLVTKAAIGNAGALRRLGIDAKVGSSSVELLTLLTQKYGGSAEAASDDASTGFDRNRVAIENVQESIGRLLLPALENLSSTLVEVAEFSENVTDALGKIGAVEIPEIEIPFNITIGGQSVGSGAGALLSKLKFTPLNPLFGITVANAIANQFKDQARAATPDLANAFAEDINLMTTNALNTAAGKTRSTPVPSFGDPGFKPLPAGNELAEGFRLAFEKAKTAAQAAASAAVAEGNKRIAVEKAAQAKEDANVAMDKYLDAQRREREQARELEQARQFRALGLDEFGAKPPPTIKNLLKQVTQLGRTDLTKNERGVLARIRKVLVDPLRKATPETRAAAKGLIDGMRDELDPKKIDRAITGPLTKTSSLRANKLIEGLGLAPDQIRELRARLSSFNSAGLANAGTTRPSGTFRGGPVTEIHTTVNLDGQVVGKSVTRSQQKDRKRNPVQKRGSRRGGV
jgi:hypothetical protein